MISYAVNFSNLIFGIHVILMGFSAIFKNNFISKNINQLSNQDFNSTAPTFNSFLLNKEKDERKIKIVNVDVSSLEVPKFEIPNNNNESIPASYPVENDLNNEISTNNIVNENFQVFCKTSFSKPKNSIKSLQPLWSFLATVKAMNTKKHIYSGEEPVDEDGNNSLILSDYANKFYDEFKFSNYVHDYDNFNSNNGNIRIFIEYIGQTLICFNLKNFNSKLQNGKMIIRVNGVIWYQVSKGLFNDYQEILIISGLTPLSQYDIQFILHDNEQDKKFLIDDLIVSTIDSNGLDISTSNTINSKVILSPLSTLQESLITTNDNLNKERLKLKKNRKEMSKKISSYKQDIENLKKVVNNSDKNDEKNYKKILSLRSQLKQVEEEISKVNDEYSVVEAKELEITEFYTIEKRKFDLNLRNFQNFQNSFQNGLNDKKVKLNELNSELESFLAKKESKLTKYHKLSSEICKSSSDLKSLLDIELSAKVKQRNDRIEKRKKLLHEFKNEIKKLENDVLELTSENEKLKREKYYR
jgi:peptidoglycan hydrolase CwlO-like protein